MQRKFRLIGATIASYCLLNSLSVPLILQGKELVSSEAAYAKSSGGRSRGGSFRSSPSRSGGSSSRNNNSGGYSGGGVYIGGSSYGSYCSTYIDGFWLLLTMLVLLGAGGWAVWMLLSARKGTGSTELDNHKVTVSKVQVALLAQGKAIQAQLSEIVENADTDTPEGLQQELQEATLALLRMPENWSHVQASSQTVKGREAAEAMFNQGSIAERSKFSAETLTNVGGKVNRKSFTPDPDQDPASYIVVTLLVGTAHDRPLFGDVRTVEALKETLEKLSSINLDYLMVFELLWSPQNETDSLTYDELLTEYTDMVQI
jgi:uncharacterized membrane protein